MMMMDGLTIMNACMSCNATSPTYENDKLPYHIEHFFISCRRIIVALCKIHNAVGPISMRRTYAMQHRLFSTVSTLCSAKGNDGTG